MTEGQAVAEEVPPGYKWTDGGVIPEDWVVEQIANVLKNIIDYRGRTPRKLGMEWGGGNIPALSARNVKMGFIDLSQETNYGSDALYRRWMTSGTPKKGDIIVTLEAPLGNVAQIPEDRRYILSQRTVLLQLNTKRVINEYLFHFIASTFFQKMLQENATGSTASGIRRSKFEKLQALIPPLPEQRAIAGALSDADGLIGALDALIEKKRAIKQAAMQQLLTGKKRLPGFEGEWVKTNLQSLCSSITDGTHYTPKYVDTGIPFYSVESVTRDEFSDTKYISPEEHAELIKRCKPERGDILLTRIGSLGDTKLIDWDVVASIYVSLALLKLKADVCSEYLYAYTKSRQFVSDVESRALLNASPKKINMKDIGDIPVFTPPSRAEQRAIGALFLDMDAEIAALERRREKTQQIKQGMMQELLTGRTRLIDPPEGAPA